MATPEKTVVVIEETNQNGRDDKDDKDKKKARMSSQKQSFDAAEAKKRSSTFTKHRMTSYGFGMTSRVSSISGRSGRSKSSIRSGTLEGRRPRRKYLNTYQLEPRKPFDCVKVTNILQRTLRDLFSHHTYHPNLSPSLALIIAGEIRYRMRYLKYDRYRIISVVTIGQRRSQSYNNAVAFIWDHERDKYTNYTMELQTAFIQVTVFAIYLD